MVAEAEVTLRQGTTRDLEATHALSQRAIFSAAVKRGTLPPDTKPHPDETRADWKRQRGLIEYLAAQPNGCYCIAEKDGEMVGYGRVVRFDGMEQLTELMVEPGHQGGGIGRAILESCWPGDPSPDLGRLVVATGEPNDLGLYMSFGVMPVCGHWQMRQRTSAFVERRSQEIDRREKGVHVLKPDRALSEWRRMEPEALGFERPGLHEHFARDRTCLATFDAEATRATSLCWVSSEGEIGPAVADSSQELVPVVLAVLDRVAATQEPEFVSVFSTTVSWWLLRRLRVLGFEIYWPSWIMCSKPLPGLDRYVPTRPPHVL
jgi:GNAT superfamily N-acetyltransferase